MLGARAGDVLEFPVMMELQRQGSDVTVKLFNKCIEDIKCGARQVYLYIVREKGAESHSNDNASEQEQPELQQKK